MFGKPTKKWWTLFVSVVAGIVTSAIASGEFGDTEYGLVRLGLVALITTYLKSNDPAPGGVPR